ncbi:MAG: right-handed parallel beta-helix repeat-containing protein [Thermoplasmata archaeon]
MKPLTLVAAIAIAGILTVSFLVASTAAGAPAAPRASPPPGAPLLSDASAVGVATSAPEQGSLEESFLGPLTHIHPLVSQYTTILPDGALAGASASITITGDIYTLTAPLTGAIIDERNGSSFQGGGNTITATGLEFGFQVNSSANVSVTDLIITGEAIGIEVINSTNVTVTDTTAGAATDSGFTVAESSLVTLRNDYSNASHVGFGVQLSRTVTIDNSIADTAGSDAFAAVLDTGVYLDDDQGEHSAGAGLGALYDSGIDANDDTFSYATTDAIVCSTCSFSSFYGMTGEDSGTGLILASGDYDYVYDSNFSFAVHDGAEIVTSTDVSVEGCQFFEAGNTGLFVDLGGDDTFSDLQANSSGVTGIDLWNLTTASLTGGYANDNGWNGLSIEHSSGVDATNITANLATASGGNGTFVEYTATTVLKNGVDQHEANGIFDEGSQGLEVLDSNASDDSAYGFAFALDEGVDVAGDASFNDGVGYYVEDSSAFFLDGDTASFDSDGLVEDSGTEGAVWFLTALHCGLGLYVEGDSNSFYYGDATNATPEGVLAQLDADTVFEDLSISGASTFGIDLSITLDVPVEQSNVSYSEYGFELDEATFSNIQENTFYHDTYDFLVTANALDGAKVWWNNFIDGGGWRFDPTGGTPAAIAFDAGYPTGGNYWSNDTTPDLESGPNQNIAGADGIVDHPLPISGSYQDHYPLTHEFVEDNLSVAFDETGLPSGTYWGVQFDVDEGDNTTGTTAYGYAPAVAYASYDYSIYAPAGWVPSPSHGTVTTNGKAQSVAIVFTQATYTTTFTESGLAPGTHWNVTVGGQVYSGTGPTITLALGNGTYNYTVSPVAGYVVAPHSGSFSVHATQPAVTVAFTAVLYDVTFTESGLPSGTAWSVTFGGSTLGSSTTTITFDVANGSYAYSVAGVSGYSLVPGSGTQLVSGPGAGVTVAFTSNASMTPGGVLLFWVLLALVILLAIVVAVLLLRGRKKTTAAPAGWTPPAGTTAPAAGGGTPAAGGPPPGVVSPPPPPNWKES